MKTIQQFGFKLFLTLDIGKHCYHYIYNTCLESLELQKNKETILKNLIHEDECKSLEYPEEVMQRISGNFLEVLIL